MRKVARLRTARSGRADASIDHTELWPTAAEPSAIRAAFERPRPNPEHGGRVTCPRLAATLSPRQPQIVAMRPGRSASDDRPPGLTLEATHPQGLPTTLSHPPATDYRHAAERSAADDGSPRMSHEGRGQAQPNRMKIRTARSRAMIPMTSITCGHGVIGFSCGCPAELVDIALPIERRASVQRLVRDENAAISRLTAQYGRMEK